MEVITIESPAFKELKTMLQTACANMNDLTSANARLHKESWISARKAADYLGLHVNTLLRYKDEIGYCQKGELRFKIADLEDWMNKDYYKRKHLKIAK